jgi:hypothetical protein
MMAASAYALGYAARGFHVLPCQPRGKLPLTEHGHHDATTDTATITQWWTTTPTANIGIACAASGIVAIDIDRHGADGFTTMKSLLAELGQLPETVAAVTGGGGRHLLFQAPAGTAFRGQLGAGVDVKHQGYILIAGCVHPWTVSRQCCPNRGLPECEGQSRRPSRVGRLLFALRGAAHGMDARLRIAK